jgi:hypothetical protein
MNSSIDNILIPIARSYDTQKAVTEAMKLAKPWQTTVHLIFLKRSWNPFLIVHPAAAFERMLNNDLDSYLKTLLHLMHWKDLIEKSSPGVSVRIHIKKGISWQSLILRTTQNVGTGVVILAPGSVRHWFTLRLMIPIQVLAKKTGCKIISIKADQESGRTEEVGILSGSSHTFFQSLSHN